MVYTVHKTTTHRDTDCCMQETPRPQMGGTNTAAALRFDTDEKPTINFDNDSDKGFQF